LVSLSNFFNLGAIWGIVDFSAVNLKFEQQGTSGVEFSWEKVSDTSKM
jgi:hypothetical protein